MSVGLFMLFNKWNESQYIESREDDDDSHV